MLQKLRDILSSHYAPMLQKDPAVLNKLLESPKQSGHGHLAMPVFAWAKEMRKAPPVLAQEFATRFSADKPQGLESVTAVSGFVNFTFSDRFIQDMLSADILGSRGQVGFSKVGAGRKMVIDFSSPNVAKPMHIGHLRASVIGQAIVNLAKTQGYQVIGLNHLGDWGVQFGKLAWAYMKWGSEYDFSSKPFESLYNIYVRFHDEAEKNPELEAEGSKVFKRLEDGDPQIRELWQKFVDISLADYQRIWTQLGIKHELVRGESFYNDRMRPVEKMLEEKGLLEESDGAMVVRLDDENMPPCLIRKSDGASLYATRDLASALYRMQELHADLNLYVVGVDQTLHFRQVFAVLKKMGYPWVEKCHHIAFGMYRFKDARISTRKGNAIFLEDVLAQAVELVREVIKKKNPDLPNAEQVARQVGFGAVIFNDLVNDRVKNVDFDWDRALDFEGDSGPYVQYCGVRCLSLMRKFGKPVPTKFATDLNTPEERELFRILLAYQDTLRNSFDNFKPHMLAGYLLDVCHRYGAFYTRCRILGEPSEVESSRMTLVQMVHAVLQEGLGILGIELPEAM
ncbi:MAG: arginine--tRNA ligase [Bdellovibrionales bacterium]|nr:arginine--tRNA ligase [Bdellovibrionales bacterium]